MSRSFDNNSIIFIKIAAVYKQPSLSVDSFLHYIEQLSKNYQDRITANGFKVINDISVATRIDNISGTGAVINHVITYTTFPVNLCLYDDPISDHRLMIAELAISQIYKSHSGVTKSNIIKKLQSINAQEITFDWYKSIQLSTIKN